MSLNTLLFSDDEEQGKQMMAYRVPSETQLILNLEGLNTAISQLPSNSLRLFQAFLKNPLLINLKSWALIYSKIQPNGFVKLAFSSISQEEFKQLSQMLKANGFLNKDPLSGTLSNEILYSKPDVVSQGKSVVVNDKNTQNTVKVGVDLANKEVCGQFSYNKLLEVDPQKKVNLVDEDDLLSNDMGYVPLEKKGDSCVTKPKACKNCSCGRKALE